MKTKLKGALDYLKSHFFEETIWKNETIEAFESGIEFAQELIPLEEDLPPLGVLVFLFNEVWIDDYNPDGLRIGFRQDDGFIHAYWGHMIIPQEKCSRNSSFSKKIQDSTEPTHWRPFKIH